MNPRPLRAILAAVALALLLAGTARPAQAHADLIRSVPAHGQSLETFPTQAEMEFSEAVDPATARVQLLGPSSNLLALGQITVDPANPALLRVALPPEPDGLYSLYWMIVSSDDEHVTTGLISFSVGANAPKASLLPAPGAPDPAADFPPAPDALLRWLGYAGLCLALGSAVFGAAVWRPAYRAAPDRLPEWDRRLGRVLSRWMIAGTVALLVSVAGLLVRQAAEAELGGDGTLLEQVLLAFSHHGSAVFWPQVLLLGMLLLFATLLQPPGSGSPREWWLAAAFGAGVALTFSLTGHNAALGLPLAVAGDWLHVLGMACWLGGLLALATVLWWNRPSVNPAARGLAARVSLRFSNLALAAVTALALTGVYSALLQVRTLPALTGTRYGQVVLAKIVLLAVLIGLGALNKLGILPGMRGDPARPLRILGRSVRVELLLGLAVLAAVGILMNLSPGYQALRAQFQMGYHQTYRDGPVQVDLRIAPAKLGENEFGVDLADNRPGAGEFPTKVTLRFFNPKQRDVVTAAEAEQTSRNRYTARGSYFSLDGLWEIEVVVQRPGFPDLRPEFKVNLDERAAEAKGLGITAP